MRGISYLVLLVCVGASLAVPSSSLTPKDPTKVLMKRDYKAPNPVPVDPPAQGYGDGADNGYYYYYYPVEEDAKKEAKTKDKCAVEKLLAPVIIMAVCLCILAANAIGLIPTITLPPITIPVPIPAIPGNRNLATAAYDYVPWNSLEKITTVVSEAIESEQCLSRLVCESGRYAEGRTTLLNLLEFMTPPRYENRMKLFKDSALKKTDCKTFKCSYAEEQKKL